MATENEVETSSDHIDRILMEQLMFGTGRVRRFTQDSPVLPDVWLEYARRPLSDSDELTPRTQPQARDDYPPVKVLLTPYRETAAGNVREAVRDAIRRERKASEWKAYGHRGGNPPRAVYNQSTVAATLYFEDLVRAVIPLTGWWRNITARWSPDALQDEAGQEALARAVMDPEHPPMFPDPRNAKNKVRLPPDVLWLIRVVGALALVHRHEPLPMAFTNPTLDASRPTSGDWKQLVAAVAALLRGVGATPSTEATIHSVSLNREASPTVSRSTLAIKADAARRLFDISCRELRWAVIDSGIDARHPAFRCRKPDASDKLIEPAFSKSDGKEKNSTRIVATYDFTQIDLLLDPDTNDQPDRLAKLLDGKSVRAKELQKTIETLNDSLKSGRSIDWKLVAPLLEVPHTDAGYDPPKNDHGTHVAGILAGDWRSSDQKPALEEDLVGVCPDLELYDLRVLNAEGRGDEFNVMAALQFVRWLNSTNDYVAVHGVNLSLSIPHDVSNYACGLTPVCAECERVAAAGIVVVAAAGNQGYRRYRTADGLAADSYNSISITDPGNAELVITVGATHRSRPHTYGVSYFSSRGPTGDGRAKPDLVAPGEKITAPLPDTMFGRKDGTSMAAPHVSGAAALLMARHNELVGQPARIKEILCNTATDLGRERYFQGAGMLDVLRALQSV